MLQPGNHVVIAYRPGIRAIVERGVVTEVDEKGARAKVEGYLDSGTARKWDLGYIPLKELTRFYPSDIAEQLTPKHICEHCGEVTKPTAKNKRFCSPTCRQAQYRARHKTCG
jgi:hypothetical protein